MARKKQKLIKTEFEFYSLKPLFERCPLSEFYYYIIFGERSNGKSFAVLEHCIKDYIANGYAFAYVRRWDSDFEKGNTREIFKGFIENPYRGNVIEELSKGRYNSIFYYLGKWYLQRVATEDKLDKEGKLIQETGQVLERDQKPFAYRFSLNTQEHVKSSAYPDIHNIVFDEFITRGYYLNGGDEFTIFTSLISTIVRLEDYVRIFMIGNSISSDCPYFREMGLRNVVKMPEEGAIDIYEYGESNLKVAVERTPNVKARRGAKKKSDVYFAFDNPKLRLVTAGGWEIGLYPHLPTGYSIKKNEIEYFFFIVYEDQTLQGDIVMKDGSLICFIHKKTTPIKNENRNLVYQVEQDTRYWYRRRITKPQTKLEKLIYSLFVSEKVFYQDNELGETIRHYLDWCVSGS